MVNIQKMTTKEANKAIEETPKRKIGEWKELLAELKKSNEGAKVTGLTRGQVAALVRQAKTDGVIAVACDKYSAVILSLPEVKKQASK